MAERKSEIELSSPEFFQHSCNLGMIVHFYQEMLGNDAFGLKELGMLASMELLGDAIPNDVFEFYARCIDYAVDNHVIIDVDGFKTAIPPFNPDDPMCADCRELVIIAMVQYAFVASIQGETNPLKDYLGGIFSYSGIAFEGVDEGYHLKGCDTQFYYKGLLDKIAPNEEKRIQYAQTLKKKLEMLQNALGGNNA